MMARALHARLADQPLAISAGTLLLFWFLDFNTWTWFRLVANDSEGAVRLILQILLRYGPWLIGPWLLASLIIRHQPPVSALGLDRSLVRGFGIGLVGTAVFAIGLAASTTFSPPEQLALSVLRSSVLPAVFEEIFYRAFLFGFLFRFAGWGFLPAALIGAVFFGAAHLYQSNDPAKAAGIFAITAFGALWFAWLYAEWNFNIWVPISFHLLMNLYWELFAVDETALGSVGVNLLRLSVIALSIGLTLRLRRDGRIITGRGWLTGRRGRPGTKA